MTARRQVPAVQILFVLASLTLVSVSGCLGTNPGTEDTKDTLTWAMLFPETINPLEITDDNYFYIIPNVYNGLVEYDKDFRVVPALAVSWNNPNNLTWRFHLRHGVYFHDGTAFTARDVKYSVERTADLSAIVESVVVLDNYTVDLMTSSPYPGLLTTLARQIVEENGTTEGLVGTGPYKVADYELGNYTRLERSELYWGERPPIQTVVFRVIADVEERLDALLSGAVDIAEYNIDDDIEAILKNPNVTVVTYPPLSTYFIGFDLRQNGSYGFPDGRNPTADVRVRKALYHAINITPLIAGPFKGFARPESQFFTNHLFGYNPEIRRLPYNLSAARQLLTEAGYPTGFTISMDCITEGYPYNAENCRLIQQQLAEVGVHVVLNHLSGQEFSTKVVRERNTSMYLIGWGVDSADGGLEYDWFIRSVGEQTGELNSGWYSNPEVDRLGIAASHEMDPTVRLRMLQEGFQIALVDDVAVVPLFSQVLFSLTAPDVYLPARADLRMVVKDIRLL